jgi:hypothetical protein
MSAMKRLAPTLAVDLVALWLAVFATTGCGAFDDFEVTLSDSVTIPGSGLNVGVFSPLPYDGGLTNLALSQDQSFQNQGVAPSDVDAIFTKSITLEDGEPRLKNFANVVESVVLFVEAPGVEKKELARGQDFPDAATVSLAIQPTLNLKPYAVAPSMTISAEVKLKQPPLNRFQLKTTITLLVDINLLGT